MVVLQDGLTAQYVVTQCQTQNDALIATDRNEWAHVNLAIVNDGYLHNFEPIEPPCGIPNLSLSNVIIQVNIIDINTANSCNGVPVFGNVHLNCPLTTSAVCTIVQDVLSPGCTFGTGTTTSGIYALNLNTCGVNANSTDVIGIDLIPATENLGTCPTIPNAVQSGAIELVYEICITYTFNQNLPDQCDNTISIACDDGDPCTTNDQEFVDECDNSIVCIPCTGVSQVDCLDTEIISCDDGDPCTINDEQTVSICDNTFVCVPCQGELQVDCNSTQELPCDDGNPCTENDVEIVSACDMDFICEPCAGNPVLDCTSIEELPCDDNDPCTENDVIQVDLCNNNEICVPCQGTAIVPLNCSDGICANGIEYWDDSSCSCETEEVILGCTDTEACNYDPLATCNFDCDYQCFDCNGTPFGTAVIDSCGICLESSDPLFNFSCLIDLYFPNAFTPDGDGRNDYFSLNTNLAIENFEINIFNRFGQSVFTSNDPHFKWFGNGMRDEYYLPADVYIYVVSYTFNGPEIIKLKGHVSILR